MIKRTLYYTSIYGKFKNEDKPKKHKRKSQPLGVLPQIIRDMPVHLYDESVVQRPHKPIKVYEKLDDVTLYANRVSNIKMGYHVSPDHAYIICEKERAQNGNS